jgi:hypothetical protein
MLAGAEALVADAMCQDAIGGVDWIAAVGDWDYLVDFGGHRVGCRNGLVDVIAADPAGVLLAEDPCS